MTPKDFEDRAKAAALPPGGVAMDPITLIVLAAALTAAVEYLVTHCLDWITEHITRSPNAAQRGVLRLWVVKPAVRRAAKERGVDLDADDLRKIEDMAVSGILTAAQSLTPAELASLKGSV